MEWLLPALSGKIKKGKSDHKSYTQAILPRKTGKEKTVAGQAASCAQNGFLGYCGGFE